MNNNQSFPQHAIVTSLIKHVMVKTAVLASCAAVIMLVYFLIKKADVLWWRVPVGILFGAALGITNFRWLAFAIERTVYKQMKIAAPVNPVMTALNALKLIAIFIVLFVIIKYQVLNVFALLFGLSFCFLAMIWEGLAYLKDSRNTGS
ncbi:MAG: ATP synthase subunit I [Nitrospirota bacterium]